MRTPDADSLRERWPAILEAVKRERRVAWILLSNATVDTLQDGILTLRFAREGEARGFSGSDYDRDLGQVLETVLGISPKIKAVSAAAQSSSPGAGGGDAAGSGAADGFGAGGDAPGGAGAGAGRSGSGAGRSRAGAGRGRARAGGTDASQGGPDAGGDAPAGAAGAAPAGVGGDVPGRAHDADAASVEALTGMDLIQRTLGGEVIEEIDDA